MTDENSPPENRAPDTRAPKTQALVVVDMQAALVPGSFNEKEVLANIATLIDTARQQQVPVIFIQHNHASFEPMMKGSPGWEIHADLAPQSQDVRIEKAASDAFYHTPLADTLTRHGINELIICGMMTEYCVDATARSALSHDFDVTLVSDGHTTGNSTLTAAQIVGHHNASLPNVVHPTRSITAIPAAAVFQP